MTQRGDGSLIRNPGIIGALISVVGALAVAIVVYWLGLPGDTERYQARIIEQVCARPPAAPNPIQYFDVFNPGDPANKAAYVDALRRYRRTWAERLARVTGIAPPAELASEWQAEQRAAHRFVRELGRFADRLEDSPHERFEPLPASLKGAESRRHEAAERFVAALETLADRPCVAAAR